MQLVRLEDAKAYDAPKHVDCVALRLQGFDASPAETFNIGLSHFLPGGGVEMGATPFEKVHICVDGELTIITQDGELTLRRYDSLHVASAEERAIENRTNLPASMITVLPYPPSHP